MAKLTRQLQKIFAEDAQSSQVTAFRTAGGVPTYTKDVSLIQNANFTTGWLEEDNSGNVIPYAEDMNGLFYTLSRNIAYLNQAGIPEWINSETYYENALCMYNGVLYISLQDNNSNRQPDTQTSYWTPYASPVGGSVTGGENTGTGTGVYTSTSSGTMSFKSLVGSGDISVSTSQDGESVVIEYTGSGGGGGGSVAWGNITGSIANQSDLATALSQRGTLSGANIWTGNNTFDKILPETTTSQIGDVGSSFLYGYILSFPDVRSIYVGSNYQRTALWYNDGTADVRFAYLGDDASSSGSIGIHPYNDAATTTSPVQYLGSPSAWWGYGYIKNLNATDTTTSTITATTATATSLNTQNIITNYTQTNYSYITVKEGNGTSSPTTIGTIGKNNQTTFNLFQPASGVSVNLASSTTPMGIIYSNNLYLYQSLFLNHSVINVGQASATASYKYNTIYGYSGSTSSTRTAWATIGYKDSVFSFSPSAASSTATLGLSGYEWAAVYATKISAGSSTLTVQGNNATNFYLSPATTANNRYLGDTSHTWSGIYTNTINAGANTIHFNASSGGNTRSVVLNPAYPGFFPEQAATLSLGHPTYTWSVVYAANGNIQSSDRNKKTNIIDLDSGLKTLNSLPVYSYTWKENADCVLYGVMAQDVLEKAPELVHVPDDYRKGNENLGIYTSNILFLAVKAIQELSAKVDNLEQQLKENQK